MPGNLKNRMRMPSGNGLVNRDLSRVEGERAADPQFYEPDVSHVDTDTDDGLKVSGGKISARPRSKSSDLPGYPVNRSAFVRTNPRGTR